MAYKYFGKICWVSDTFTYVGFSPKKSHDLSAGQLTDILIDEVRIQFNILPFTDGQYTYSYFVNLVKTDRPGRWKGGYKNLSDESDSFEVEGELFENENGLLLLGKWIDRGKYVFTFWVKFHRDNDV